MLEGVSPENRYSLETVRAFLPRSLTLEDGKTVTVLQWDCDTYTMDAEGNWPLSGAFLFRAALSENIAFAEAAPGREIPVILEAAADGKFSVPQDESGSSVHGQEPENIRILTEIRTP